VADWKLATVTALFDTLHAMCNLLILPPENLRYSVADPGCLSRIPEPDFYLSRISDPKTATKERGEKKFVIILFLKSQISQN
jgi:hypothetical protein